MKEYKSTDRYKQCLALKPKSQSTSQMLQVLVIHFVIIKKKGNEAYGAIKPKTPKNLNCTDKTPRDECCKIVGVLNGWRIR